MELMKNSTFITIFLLFLLTTPHFATAGRELSEMVDSTTEVYEIDYRGPETHSSTPPPGRLHGNKNPLPNAIHKESVNGSPKSKRFRAGNHNMGRKVMINPGFVETMLTERIRAFVETWIHTKPYPECWAFGTLLRREYMNDPDQLYEFPVNGSVVV